MFRDRPLLLLGSHSSLVSPVSLKVIDHRWLLLWSPIKFNWNHRPPKKNKANKSLLQQTRNYIDVQLGLLLSYQKRRLLDQRRQQRKKTAMNRQIFHFRTWCLAFSWKRSWVGMLFGLYWKRGSLSRIEVQKCHYTFVIRWQACENVRRSMGWSECNEFLALEMRHAASLKFTSGLTHFPNYFISWKALWGRCAKDSFDYTHMQVYVLTHFLFELFMIILVEIFDMFLLQCRNFPKQLLGSPQRQLSRKDEAESASYGPNMLI